MHESKRHGERGKVCALAKVLIGPRNRIKIVDAIRERMQMSASIMKYETPDPIYPGRIVIHQDAVQPLWLILDQAPSLPAPELLHGRNRRRVASAQHAHVRVGGKSLAQLLHQFLNAAGTTEFVTESGEFEHLEPFASFQQRTRFKMPAVLRPIRLFSIFKRQCMSLSVNRPP